MMIDRSQAELKGRVEQYVTDRTKGHSSSRHTDTA